MNSIAIFISTILLAIVGVGCSTNNVYIPPDAAQIHYSSVTISITTGKSGEVVEGGFLSGIIFEPGLLVGNSNLWSDGSPTNVAIGISSDEFTAIVSELVREFGDIDPVYTYSAWLSGSERDPSLGIYTSDYFSNVGDNRGISIRLSGVKDDYNRSMWLVVPINQIDSSFWGRLKTALPEDEKFSDLIQNLHTFWTNNA